MKKCPECLGKGRIMCSICKGSCINPRNIDKPCGYCGSSGHIKCNVCGGSGKLDDDDDYRR